MKNSEKTELRKEIRELDKEKYSKKEAIEILVSYGYVKSTASRYWDLFAKGGIHDPKE